jgi:hypothetical protein
MVDSSGDYPSVDIFDIPWLVDRTNKFREEDQAQSRRGRQKGLENAGAQADQDQEPREKQQLDNDRE